MHIDSGVPPNDMPADRPHRRVARLAGGVLLAGLALGRPDRRRRLAALVVGAALALPGVVMLAGRLAVPAEAASSPVAYVTNNGSNTVSVVDTGTNTVTGSITVGTSPQAVAVNTAGTTAYVANQGSNTVSVIRTSTSTVTATIAVGASPDAIAVSPDGATIYVADFGDNNVSVISAATNTVTATITVGTNPSALAVTPDGSKVYVANHGAGSVSVISTSAGAVTATVPVDGGPQVLVMLPSGSAVYAAGKLTGISVISTATDTVAANIVPGAAITGGQALPDGSQVYLCDNGNEAGGDSGSVENYNTATNTIITAFSPATSGLHGLALTPDGTTGYVTDAAGIVDVFATASNTQTATIGGFNSPTGIVIFTPAATPPVVTGISPVSGPTSGGTSVTITGTGFTGATSVKFGSTPATSFAVTSDTSITAASPAESAGTVDVTVTTPGGTSATSPADRYTYQTPCPAGTRPNFRWHYSGQLSNGTFSSGSWSGTTTETCPGAFSMGPQAMEGDLHLNPGATLKAGYDFTLPGNHNTLTLNVDNPSVVFTVHCASGANPSSSRLTVPMPTQSYLVTNDQWIPSGDQSSPLVYQGQITVPDLCGGGALRLDQGGTFTASLS